MTAVDIIAAGPLLVPAAGSPLRVREGVGNVTIGDVNNDRRPDLLATSSSGRRLAVLLGRGDGQFASTATGSLDVPESPHEIAVGDLLTKTTGGAVPVGALTARFGDGLGAFKRAAIPVKTGRAWFAAIGDLNGDGKQYLATTQ